MTAAHVSPLHAPEAERAVIGAMLLPDPDQAVLPTHPESAGGENGA